MLIKRQKRRVPQLNTTATADISFMLLTFFLVTTSMDVDKGLVRQLPPMDDTQQNTETDIDKHHVMAFRITADNRLTLDGEPTATNGLRDRIATFITRTGNTHAITIDCDPDAGYGLYFTLEDEIVAAYASVRNHMAVKRYGKEYARLTQQQKDDIREACPQHVAETYDTTADTTKKGGQQ